MALKPAVSKKVTTQKKDGGIKPERQAEAVGDDFQVLNPYNRCSLFGAALVAAEVFDPDFCIHGPQGCASAVIEGFLTQGKELEFHHSGMTQQEVIFGGDNLLLENVRQAFSPYEKAGPKYVFTSCTPEIIGDNTDAVCAKFNRRLPLVKVSSCGFKNDQYAGIEQTLCELLHKFADTKPIRRGKMVNLIGHIGLSRQWRADVYELTRLLGALGLEVNRIACDSTIEDLQKSSSAALTIILIPEVGSSPAKQLQERFDIPYTCSPMFLPLGLRGTEAWLNNIGAFLSVSKEEIEKLVNKEEEKVRDALKVGLNDPIYASKLSALRRLPVSVIAEGTVAYSWARFVAEELDMMPVFLGMRTGADIAELTNALENLQKDICHKLNVIFRPNIGQIKNAMANTGTKFIMGSSVEAEYGKEIGIGMFLHIANPNTQYVNINRIPFLGYNGLLFLVEAILNTLDDSSF